MSTPLLLVISILPGALLLHYVRKLDRLEPEPAGLIAKLLVFGALSTIPASLVESVLSFSVPVLDCLIIGFTEEICKYTAARLCTWKNKEFNCTYDGVVYCASAAIGFAVLENIGYIAMFGFGTAVLRFFTAVPAHAAMGILMGIRYGQAKEAQLLGNRSWKSMLRGAVIIPALFHAVYDYSADSEWGFLLLLAALFVIYRVILKDIKQTAAKDHWIGEEEQEEHF